MTKTQYDLILKALTEAARVLYEAAVESDSDETAAQIEALSALILVSRDKVQHQCFALLSSSDRNASNAEFTRWVS